MVLSGGVGRYNVRSFKKCSTTQKKLDKSFYLRPKYEREKTTFDSIVFQKINVYSQKIATFTNSWSKNCSNVEFLDEFWKTKSTENFADCPGTRFLFQNANGGILHGAAQPKSWSPISDTALKKCAEIYFSPRRIFLDGLNLKPIICSIFNILRRGGWVVWNG